MDAGVCFFPLTLFYYSDWAGGYVNSTGNGEPLHCPDGRSSLRSNIDYTHPALPDVFYVYHDLHSHPKDYFKVWMKNGDVHNASNELVGRYQQNELIEMGACHFPPAVENDHENLFKFLAKGVVRNTVNLTLCAAPPAPT
jgi:hypothetical protein